MPRARTLPPFVLGALAGTAVAAAFVRRSLASRGDEESDEVALVAIFDGVDFKSRSPAFGGGSILAWFGGVTLDLREAQLAPGARLSVSALFGGIAVKTPPEWRIESRVHVLLGGADTRNPAGDDPDAPVLAVEGRAVLGGIAVGPRAFAKAD
jgi:hypothetical protein